MQLMFVLIVAGALAAAVASWRRSTDRGGRGAAGGFFGNRAPVEVEAGTLYVTGVSPRPEAPGEQYVTLSGSISGPSVVAHEVYGRFAWDTFQWPAIGDRIPVQYPSGKPDNWQLDHPGARPYFGSKRPKGQG
ncbi:hypothetical protein D7D52_08895 [Nocardia yunnanensis]|uniref:Uncharacterized protein n=1 Tax=Nocardia yunnanensis TaxID=2382165 RepID=A0A386ZQV7_9NOCA|nr:hypothetical protein D7D52_08895 [Nocardia yunnanensis]